jgi:hypothetical protein
MALAIGRLSPDDGAVSLVKTMSIKPLQASASFNPEVIALMAVAIERICRSGHLGQHPAAAEAVARKVMELAQGGV